jgi:hypothetical protein
MSTGLYSGTSGLALGVGLYKGYPGLWGNAAGLIKGLQASLALDFLADGALDPRVTFSRTSNATLVDSTGNLTYAPNNLVVNSEAFDAATWVKFGTTSVAANADIAPNGTLTADAITLPALSGIYRNVAATVGTGYVVSVWLRAASPQSVRLVSNTDTGVLATLTCSVTTTWQRFYLYRVAPAGSATVGLQLDTGGGGTFYAWGAQLEAVTYQTTPSTYNSTSPANLLGYTQEFDNAAWTKTAASITANAATAPDGTLSADKIIATAVLTTHSAGQNLTVISGTTFTGSVYAKAGEYNFAAVLLLTTFAAAQIVICDLSTGTISSTSGSPLATSVTDVGNGWYRISITQVTNAAGTATMQVRPSNVGTTTAFTGDGTSGVYIWGAQLSNSGSLDPYVYNPAAALTSTAYYGPRFDYDPANLTAKGLLIEEQRTNLFLNSKIDGTNLATQNVTTTATAYTISFYGTGTITLTGTSTAGPIVGTGVYPTRTTLTFTPTAGTLTCTVTGTVQYAQIEAGAFATSYIPTVAATVTRAADIARMLGTNFSSWFNASTGTFVASYEASPNQYATYIAASNGNVGQNSIHFDNDASGVMRAVYYSASAPVATLSLGSYSPVGAVNTVASAYALDDFAASRNGGTVVTDTSGALPVSLTQFNIGADPSGAAVNVTNTHIRSITYYPTHLPDATLQSLTA